jgi:predicted amidophosphoribosyltransferase
MRCPSCKKEFEKAIVKVCPHCGASLDSAYQRTRGEHKTSPGLRAVEREKDERREEERD